MPSPRLSILASLLAPFFAFAQGVDPARDLVDPFVGTGGHGHTFPGACVPNGLVQLSPDTRPDGYNDWDGCGGYHYSDSLLYGFSHTHLSGTGVPDLCDVLLMPMSGTPSFDPAGYRSHFTHAKEQANAGHYQVHLDDPQVDVELTATARVGVHRYRFRKTVDPWVVLDLDHRDQVTEHRITFEDDRTISGLRRSSSWARDQQLFFVVQCSRPFIEQRTGEPKADGMAPSKVAVRFAPSAEPLVIKVGISAVSVEGARKNLEAEVPGWDFDAVRRQAEAAWNAKLARLTPRDATRDEQRTFYTALYHCYVAPYLFNDVDGHYRGMDGQVHHADHNVYTVFSLWDTFRALHPLMTLLEPDMTNDLIKTFLLQYQQGGRLPVWELWGNETDCMIGYHSVSVIADAYVKGIRGFDADLALQAMVASAMRDEPGLNAYRTRGYISSEDAPESVSRTLEYAYDDRCIAQMAHAMGRDSLAEAFQRRSRNWRNLFDPRTGFFRARYNGGFKEPFDPYEVNFTFTEANAWQYAFFVPHDLPAFMAMLGGADSLDHRLDRLFAAHTETTGREQADITGLIGQYAHGNEPSHHTAYLYDQAGRPEKAVALVERIMREFYHDAPDGLAGNEDCGQMSAWYVMSALGLYPVAPGSDRYWVGRQAFGGIASPFSAVIAAQAPGTTIAHGKLSGGRPLPSPALPPADAISDGPVPIIQAERNSFHDALQVTITCVPGPWTIRYGTTDAPERFKPYEGPLMLTESTDLYACTFPIDGNGPISPVVRAHFTRVDGHVTITLDTPYAKQYAAGGDEALVDGLRGGNDFRTGEWQGFHGTDVLATIDLGEVRKLGRVGLSVLQDQGAWIWYPSQVSYAWSTNGRTWSSATVTNAVPRDADGSQQQVLWTGPISKKARYIKVIATNAGPCPGWHPGMGGTSWIFADEVMIEAE